MVKVTDPPFLPILVIIIIFFFLGWKSILRYLRNVSQILGGYVYQNPPKWGLIHKYNNNCMYHIIVNRNYLEKYIVNKKILMNKMYLEFNFTYAVLISSGSVNKYVTSRDTVTSL